MQTLISIVSHLEAHQGSCMVLLTVALVICAIVSCVIAARSIRMMQKLEAKKSSPYVVIETTQSVPFYGVKVINTGLTAAKNVSIEVAPQLGLLFPNYRKPIGFVDRPLAVLVPGQTYSTDIGNFDQIRNQNPSMKYRCVVRYESEWGEWYQAEYVLDYTIYEHLIHKSEMSLTDLVQRLEEFVREFTSFANGSHKPHVLTENYEQYEARIHKILAAELVEKIEKHGDKKSGVV